jgi:putative Holliday junction resolvase
MKVLAVDPGEKRLGIAISDPTGTIASPFTVLKHVSRLIDAAEIAQIARENSVEKIIIGESLDEDNQPTLQSRGASRLGIEIGRQSELPVVFWDETGSTQAARQSRIEMGVRRSKRRGHMDDLAAAVILQSYLDAQAEMGIKSLLPPETSGSIIEQIEEGC